MSDDPKDPPQPYGSGMTHRDGPSERALFMEQERDEAWERWAADRSKNGPDYRDFIESYYDLGARGRENLPQDPPSLEDIGKPSTASSAPGRDMGELAAREPSQAPSLSDLGSLPDPMRGTGPSDEKTVRQIGRDLLRQGVTDPDNDLEPGS